MNRFAALLLICFTGFWACKPKPSAYDFEWMILGVAQDGGYPQAGCTKKCCELFEKKKTKSLSQTCLALYDRKKNKIFFFEATPEYPLQWRLWKEHHPEFKKTQPDAFFITHAHIGHYTGLIHLGREVMGSNHVPVYVFPRMAHFLQHNGPWSQLTDLKNITLHPMKADSAISVSADSHVVPFEVPHRDEFSETAGFKIITPGKTILFIPDIDKWHLWKKDIKKEIKESDLVFVDATFYKNGELKRDMSEIPHPFVEESIQLFDSLNRADKNKIHFIHFNHTNPLIWDESAKANVEGKGYRIARQGQIFKW